MRNTFAGASIHCFMASSACSGVTSFEMRMSQGMVPSTRLSISRTPPFWYELAANGGDAQAQFATGWFLMTGTGVPQDERKGLKWIHKATFQGYQPAIEYCKEHGYK